MTGRADLRIGSAIVWIILGYFAIVLGNIAWVWWRGRTEGDRRADREVVDPPERGSAR